MIKTNDCRYITNKQALKEARAKARANGFTLKPAACYINSKQAWQITHKATGCTVAGPMPLWDAWRRIEAGDARA
jgi:hypothetical protein